MSLLCYAESTDTLGNIIWKTATCMTEKSKKLIGNVLWKVGRHFGNFSVFEIFRHVTTGHEGRSLAMIYRYDPDSPLFQKTLLTPKKLKNT